MNDVQRVALSSELTVGEEIEAWHQGRLFHRGTVSRTIPSTDLFWITESETGTRRLIDLAALVVLRLPPHGGSRADGGARADGATAAIPAAAPVQAAPVRTAPVKTAPVRTVLPAARDGYAPALRVPLFQEPGMAAR